MDRSRGLDSAELADHVKSLKPLQAGSSADVGCCQCIGELTSMFKIVLGLSLFPMILVYVHAMARMY